MSKDALFLVLIVSAAGCAAEVGEPLDDSRDELRSVGTAPIVIQEVAFADSSDSPEAGYFELRNAGAYPINIRGYAVQDLAGTRLARFPSLVFPAGAHLVVAPSDGRDDLDLSDGQGTLFLGEKTFALTRAGDGLGLTDARGTIVDFLAWQDPEVPSRTGPTETAATRRLLWRRGDRVPTVAFGLSKGAVAPAISRDDRSTDRNSSADFVVKQATPGTSTATATAEIELREGSLLPEEPWTIMLYFADDDATLDGTVPSRLHRIESAILEVRPEARIVALVDTKTSLCESAASTGTSSAGTCGHAFRGELRGDSNPNRTTFYAPSGRPASEARLGEINTGDGATLSNFVAWAKRTYPADHYALVIAGHGGSWLGVANDQTTGGPNDAIQIGELGAALTDRVDLIAFDACHMAGIEVAYELRNAADHMLASESVIRSDHFSYRTLIQSVGRDSDRVDAATIAAQLIGRYATHMASDSSVQGHMADIELSRVSAVVSAIAQVSADLGALATTRNPNEYGGLDDHGPDPTGRAYAIETDPDDNIQTRVGGVIQTTQHFQRGKFGIAELLDLRLLVERLELHLPPNYGAALREVERTAALAIRSQVRSSGFPAARGLSIYFPSSQHRLAPAHPKSGASAERPYNRPVPASSEFAREFPAGSPMVKYGPDVEPFRCRREDPELPIGNAPAFDFPTASNWHRMLQRFFEPVADASCTLSSAFAPATITCTARGSSQWDAPYGGITHTWDIIDEGIPTPTDADFDCRAETNDDIDVSGSDFSRSLDAGLHIITLTTLDNADHEETDQDGLDVFVNPATISATDATALPEQPLRYRVGFTNWSSELLRNVRIEAQWPTDELADPRIESSLGTHATLSYDEAGWTTFVVEVGTVEPGVEAAVDLFASARKDVDEDGVAFMAISLFANDLEPLEQEFETPWGVFETILIARDRLSEFAFR